MVTSEGAQGGGKKSARAEAELRARLADGTYPQGTFLPPQRTLMGDLAVSRSTLQKVLDKLAVEGLIQTRQGSGSRVLKAGNPGRSGSAATPGLSEVITKAFQEPKVTVDTLTLTSEVLVSSLTHPVELVCSGNAKAPREVRIRILLPTEDEHRRPAFPRALDPADPRIWLRWRGMARFFRDKVRGLVRELSAVGVDATLEVRRAPITPTQKLYIINDSEVLHASYVVDEVVIPVEDGSKVPALDALGELLELTYVAENSEREQDRKQFEDLAKSFHSYWTYLSEPDSAPD